MSIITPLRITVIIALTTSACCIYMMLNLSELHAKIRPVGFSAGTYDHLDALCWPEFKQKISRIFDYPSLSKVSMQDDLGCCIARVGEITWGETERQEVGKFLIDTAEKIVSDKKYITETKKEKIPTDVHDVPAPGSVVAEILIAYGRVTDSLDAEKVNKIWDETSDSSDFSKEIRWCLDKLLEQQLKSDDVLPLIEKWIANSSGKDRITLENKKQWLETYRPFVLLNDTEAWELQWERYKPNEYDILFSAEYYGKIQGNLDSFLRVRHAQSMLMPNYGNDLDISFMQFKQTSDIAEKYFYLACTINIARRSTYTELTDEFWDDLENSVKEMSATIAKESEYQKINARDYNLEYFNQAKSSYLFFKKRKHDEEAEKVSLRENRSDADPKISSNTEQATMPQGYVLIPIIATVLIIILLVSGVFIARKRR
ncbi:MAG: hypothetical protein ACRC2T_16210 [Thermoguttaceae bacterium]